jgi:hypothetical protein
MKPVDLRKWKNMIIHRDMKPKYIRDSKNMILDPVSVRVIIIKCVQPAAILFFNSN